MATLLTPTEVARRLNIDVEELHQLRKTNQGPAWVRINQKTIRYVSDDVVVWAQKQQQNENIHDAKKYEIVVGWHHGTSYRSS